LVHVEKIDLSSFKKEDFEVIAYLKSAHPDLYRNLRKAVRARSTNGKKTGADGH
jgi:hypothetical protein